MQTRTRMRYFAIVFCIFLTALIPGTFAGCGIDPNPYDDDPGPLPNGYYPPTPDFYATPVLGYAPMLVSFTDMSTNVPLYWAWNFGDGQSSNDKNPVHSYQSPGIYTVTLTAGNGYGGNSVSKADYIVVNAASQAPVVDFMANVTSGNAPLDVKFVDTSDGGMIVSRTWTFTTNNLSETVTTQEQELARTFSGPGDYHVTLTVTAGNGQSATLHKACYISVREPAPLNGTITLYPGWNLVCTPLPLQEKFRTAGDIFSSVDTDSRSVYAYNAGTRQFIPLMAGSLINPLDGIWIYSKNKVNITFNYDITRPVTISRHLPSGWNLIGYPSLKQGYPREVYGSINTIWSIILCFDPVTQRYTPTIFNEGVDGLSNKQLMQPLNGYWIYLPTEGDLSVIIE